MPNLNLNLGLVNGS